ncbi:MAG: hypothetical protein EA380_08600 [Phycisphaeraceae bacterium]|nr:MAG: hypothetical protein EA380_08600 [Phycisphaeraceae bacterium]
MSKTVMVSLLAGAAIPLGSAAAAYTTPDEVRAIVAEALSDAQTRSSLLQSGASVGHDGRSFFIGDASGNFRLEIGGLVQTRYTMNFRDSKGDAQGRDFDSGFSIARSQLSFAGHVVNPNLFYGIKAEFNGDDIDNGDFNLRDAFLGYRWDNGWQVKFGQFRTRFLQEDNILDEFQLAAERSLTNAFFRQGESQGIELGYLQEDFRIFLAFTDGFRSRNTQFTEGKTLFAPEFDPITGDLSNGFDTAIGGGEADLAFTARADIKFSGMWDQFDSFTSMPGSGDAMAMMLGLAAHYEFTDSDRVTGAGGDAWYFSATADFTIQGDGWNFFVAGIWGHSDVSSVVTNEITGDTSSFEFDDFGIVVQGGIFIPDTDWEVFARYDVLFLDNDRFSSGDDNFSTITVGTNWYWAGQAAKFTFDLQWFIDEATALTQDNAQVGYFRNTEKNQVALRFQFQLLF